MAVQRSPPVIQMSCLLLRAEVEEDLGLTACRQRASKKRNFMDWGEGGGGRERGAFNLCTLTLLQQMAQHKSPHSTNYNKDSRIQYFLQFLPRHQISDFSTFSSWVGTLKLENKKMFVMHTQVSCTNVCVSYHVCNAHTSILH